MTPPNTQYYEAVSVEQELPPIGETVHIIMNKESVASEGIKSFPSTPMSAYFINGKWCWEYGEVIKLETGEKVTHWLKPISIVSEVTDEVSDEEIRNFAMTKWNTRHRFGDSNMENYITGMIDMRSKLAPTIAVLKQKLAKEENASRVMTENSIVLESLLQQEKEKSRESAIGFLEHMDSLRDNDMCFYLRKHEKMSLNKHYQEYLTSLDKNE